MSPGQKNLGSCHLSFFLASYSEKSRPPFRLQAYRYCWAAGQWLDNGTLSFRPSSCHELGHHFFSGLVKQCCCDAVLLNQLIDAQSNKRDPTKRSDFLCGSFIQDYLSLRCNMYEDKNLSVFILASPLLQWCFSDIQHISFCFFSPTFFFLLSPFCWIVDISADWQYEGKKKKNLLPFLSVWCVFCHCVSLLTPLTLRRWLQEVTPVITAENRAHPSLSSHASFPHLFFHHISFQLNSREWV